MKSNQFQRVLCYAGVLMALFAFQGFRSEAYAADVKELLKQVNKELRQANRDMFGGKSEKAIAALEQIKEKLIQSKQIDPNNPRIKGYENKYKKLVKDLERRTGKDLGGETLTTSAASTETELASKPAVKPLAEKKAPSPVPVQEGPAGLAKEAESLIRKAERNMFSGKKEAAASQLKQAEAVIREIKTQDPEISHLSALENRLAQVQKKLSARAPKTGTPSVPVKEKVGKKAAVGAKLPYNARRPVEMAERDLESIDKSAQRLSDPKWNKDQLLQNMRKSLESARRNLENGKAEAAKKGVTSHPKLDELETGIQGAEEKIAEADRGIAQSREKAAASAKEVTGDVAALKAEYDRVRPVFDKAAGSVIYYNDLGDVKTLIEQIEGFEKDDRGGIQQQMQAFGEKYGTTRDEIDRKADQMGYENTYYRASFAYTELSKGIENIEKTRTVMADDLVRRAEEMKTRTSKGIHDFARLKQHARIKAWGAMAARFDPDSPRVKAFNQGIDAWVVADAEALNAKIDRATFPKQVQDAPKDAQKLAKAAKAFLQKEEDKLAAEKEKEVSRVLRVVVTGPWRVFKKNLLGEPIQYNLPIATAVQTQSEKQQDLARVYLSTMLTQEMKGVKKAPPYLGATVGDSYYIRPSAVK